MFRYFREVSRNWLNPVRAQGVMGPFPAPTLANGEPQYRTDALNLAGANGVNFGNYDTNRDGRVTNEELTVFLVIAQASGELGANRPTAPSCFVPTNNTVQVCLKVGSAPESASFNTFPHEMAHSWGAKDLYGPPGVCANDQATLMSCSQPNRVIHLDPWHKMRLRWTGVRFWEIGTPGTCLRATAVNVAGGVAASGDPILIYDPTRGRSEFFLLEHRAPEGQDIDTLPRGLAVWHVRIKTDRSLAQRTAFIGPGVNGVLESTLVGDDFIRNSNILEGANRALQSTQRGDDQFLNIVENNLYTANDGALGRSVNGLRYWNATDGEFALRWADGSDSSVLVRVAPLDATTMAVRLRRDSQAIPAPTQPPDLASCYAATR